MPTYEAAPAEALTRIEQLLERYHGPLRDAGVKVDYLFALPTVNKNGDDVGHAISHGGYRCAAKVRVIGLKDRAKGMGDAEIIVDGRQWDEWDDGERDAVLDHELEHIVATGKIDDLERPKLRLIKHDHQFGWFDSIVRRHGKKAIEWRQYERLAVGPESVVSQLWLPFIGDDAGSLLSRPAKLPETRDSLVGDVRAALVDSGIPFVENVRVGGGSRPRKAKA